MLSIINHKVIILIFFYKYNLIHYCIYFQSYVEKYQPNNFITQYRYPFPLFASFAAKLKRSPHGECSHLLSLCFFLLTSERSPFGRTADSRIGFPICVKIKNTTINKLASAILLGVDTLPRPVEKWQLHPLSLPHICPNLSV